MDDGQAVRLKGKIRQKFDLNPDRHPCKRCGKIAERFCYDIDRTMRSPYCAWFCLNCEQDRFTKMFDNVVREINKNYQPGVIEHIKRKYPERWRQSLEVEKRLNGIWDEGKDLEAFQKVVDEWEKIEIELLKLFQQDNKQN